MKFLALREALEKAIPIPEAPFETPEVPTIPFYSPGEKQQVVVGGNLLRTPINKTAAMVIQKAPWWAHLNEINNAEGRGSDSLARTYAEKSKRSARRTPETNGPTRPKKKAKALLKNRQLEPKPEPLFQATEKDVMRLYLGQP